MKSEIILYQPNDIEARLEVRIEEDTVWLNRQQISLLFDRDIKTIGKHINNVFSEGELNKNSTVANFATVQNEGGRLVERQVEFFNLDVIISVGYRVKSKQGTQFRIWATNVLKDYLLKGYAFNVRMNRVEYDIEDLKSKVGEIDLQIKSSLLPAQGIFFEGQIFDAYLFAGNLIRRAKESLILIDNYVDDSVLTHFTKRSDKVNFHILTKNISKQLQLDIEKHNSQYKPVMIKKFEKAHDRFLIIDHKEVYHLGASLKDLGKKWFAFSKLDKSSVSNILNEIKIVVGF
jgi:hypothetical protein